MRKTLLFLFILISFVSKAQNGEKAPKIGLVLSGGGAKGLAHIGVLKILEEYGIEPDYIVGTSMGSIVGGLYAIGYSASEIERISKRLDWDDHFSDYISQRSISIEEKHELSKYIGQIAFKRFRPILPKGLILGQKLSITLASLMWTAHQINEFDSLAIPFRCVATDIETGEAIVLKNGYLHEAVRASMAIPSVFEPININGHLLVDGGLVQNFPVTEVLNMGADIVIGVNVTAPLYRKEELNSVFQIMDQAASFRGAKRVLEEEKKCDILILPNMLGVGASDFSSIDSLIIKGEQAALLVSDQLQMIQKKHSISNKNTNKHDQLYSIYINTIRIEGLDKVSSHLVLGKLHYKIPGFITRNQVEKGIERVYGSQFFKKVSFRIERTNESSDLVILVEEQPTNFFRFGINYTNVYNAGILLNTTFLNALGEGSKLSFGLKISENPTAEISYAIHTKWKPNIGIRFQSWMNQFEAVSYSEARNYYWNSNYIHVNNELSLESALTNSFLLKIGGRFEYQYFKSNITLLDQFDVERNLSGLFFQLELNTYDRSFFPIIGTSLFVESYYGLKELIPTGETVDQKFIRNLLLFSTVRPISSEVRLQARLHIGAIFSADSLSKTDMFYLGSNNPYEKTLIPFYGLDHMQIGGQALATASLGVQLEPWTNKIIFLNAEFGVIADKTDNILNKNKVAGIEIGLGVTVLNIPFEIDFGYNNLSHGMLVKVKLGFFF